MIQDIEPLKFDNSYKEKNPKEGSVIFSFRGKEVLVKEEKGFIEFPRYEEIESEELSYTYLFSIDDLDYFLADDSLDFNQYEYRNIQIFRTAKPQYLSFAGITAFQLFNWYQSNKFCGRCGNKLKKDHKERMLYCDECHNTIYPKISPAVIVAVSDGDKLLMTKYARGEYRKYALIAGFTEIGETSEETVKREVMEEVGLKVKDIKYYKSQPWSFSDTLLMGFSAKLDGSSKIIRDKEELAVAEWVKRDEIVVQDTGLSLTNEMIRKFKNKEI